MNGTRLVVRLQAGVMALAISALLVNSAQAALLAYEPFNYPVGSGLFANAAGPMIVPSLGGDFGWKEVWRGNSATQDTNIQSMPGSLYYQADGRRLQTMGNHWWASGDADADGDNFPGGENNSTQNPWRRLDAPAQRGYSTTEDSTTWISFLAQVATQVTVPYTGSGADGGTINYGRGVGPFQLFNNAADNTGDNNAQGNEHLSFGRGTQNSENVSGTELNLANDTWGALNRGAAAQSKVTNVPLNSLVMILVRIDHKAGLSTNSPADDHLDDIAYMWVNPSSLTVEPNIATADVVISPNSFSGAPWNVANDRDYNFNRIRIFAGNINAAVGYSSVKFDEFRIGETFADVTPNLEIPEPGSAVLAALGLVALAARRRK